MNDTDTEFISVLVPKEQVTKVYGFIASLDDGAADASADAPAVQKETQWTPALIRRQFEESPDTMKRFQRVLAERPDEWFSTAQIAAKLNASKGSKTIAGALGAYGRRTSHRYGMKGWPFEYKWNHIEEQQYYSMDEKTAEIIRSL